MKSQRITSILGTAAIAMGGLLFQAPSRVTAQGANPNANDGAEVLTRGPIHEAFAQPDDYNPTLGAVISRQSPASIEEIPPDERPEGDALWIPGYWQWDDDRDDFIWISGIWRLPPPDQSWIPGYWTPASGGWTWTPGFWMAAEIAEVEYLNQPPSSLELGPSSPPPSVNHLWAPGCWLWSTARYAWRPGYWVEARPEWIWQPSHYIRTPRGCIYVDGYWDRPLERRGVIFAPVYFDRPIYAEPHYRYSPSIVIEVSILITHLFVDERRHHYSFGDYYGDEYSRRGCLPWFEYHNRHHGYDPIYVHERWNRHRNDSHWDDRIRDDYRYRVEHSDARPPRVYRDQSAFEARAPENKRGSFRMAAPLREVSARKDNPIRFEKIDDNRRQSFEGKGKDLAKYRDERAKWESKEERGGESNGNHNGKADDKRSEPPSKSRPDSKDSRRDQPKDAAKDRNDDRPSNQNRDNRNPSANQSKGAGKEKHEERPSRQDSSSKQPSRSQSREAGEGQPSPNTDMAREKSRGHDDSQRSERVRIPKSPVAGKPKGESSHDGNPPARPDMPKAESKDHSQSKSQDGKSKSESASPQGSRGPSPSENNDRRDKK